MWRPDDPVSTAPTADDVWAHRDHLLRTCRSILGDTAVAEDVVSDTIVRALERLDRVEQRDSLLPWLSTVARRECLKKLRRSRRHPSVSLEASGGDDGFVSAGPGPDRLAWAADALARVGLVLAEMSPEERDLLLGRARDELSIAELAARHRTSEGAVRTNLMRLRDEVRSRVPDAATWVFAPLLRLGASLRRRAERVVARAQNLAPAAPASIGAEQLGEVLTAGALALVLTIGPAPPAVVAPNVLVAAERLAPAVPVSSPDAVAVRPARVPATGDGERPGPVARAAEASPGSPAAAEEPGGTRTTTTTGPASPLPGGLPPVGQVPKDPPPPPGPPPDPAPDEEAEQPEEAAFDQVVATDSGEVFALGRQLGWCKVDCARLFHSPDGGATWERLPAAGLNGLRLLVPPGWPADPVLYAMGPDGLQVSRDGGATFAAVPGAGHYGPAAMAPGFSSGDRRILIGEGPGWEHDAATGATRPAPVAPLAGAVHHFAFDPDYAASRLLYAGTMRPDRSGLKGAAVARCIEGVCRDATVLPGLRKPPAVYAERGPGGVVLAGTDGKLFRSLDGARTFEAVDLPVTPEIWAADDDGSGRLYLAAWTGEADPGGAGLVASDDHGRTWRLLGEGTPLDGGAQGVAVLPDGHVVAAPTRLTGGGLLCSADHGSTWSPRCTP